MLDDLIGARIDTPRLSTHPQILVPSALYPLFANQAIAHFSVLNVFDWASVIATNPSFRRETPTETDSLLPKSKTCISIPLKIPLN